MSSSILFCATQSSRLSACLLGRQPYSGRGIRQFSVSQHWPCGSAFNGWYLCRGLGRLMIWTVYCSYTVGRFLSCEKKNDIGFLLFPTNVWVYFEWPTKKWRSTFLGIQLLSPSCLIPHDPPCPTHSCICLQHVLSKECFMCPTFPNSLLLSLIHSAV